MVCLQAERCPLQPGIDASVHRVRQHRVTSVQQRHPASRFAASVGNEIQGCINKIVEESNEVQSPSVLSNDICQNQQRSDIQGNSPMRQACGCLASVSKKALVRIAIAPIRESSHVHRAALGCWPKVKHPLHNTSTCAEVQHCSGRQCKMLQHALRPKQRWGDWGTAVQALSGAAAGERSQRSPA